MFGITPFLFSGNNVIECYQNVQEKKNDKVAAVIANYSNSKQRASATAIGAAFGVFQGVLYAGGYGLAKMFPKLQNNFVGRWVVNSVDNWIQKAKASSPNGGFKKHFITGILSKAAWLALSGAVVGYAADWYKTYKNTNINGKICNSQKGEMSDSNLIASLKSLSTTKKGEEAIAKSIKVNDDSYTIKFKGINKEYTITKQELKDASHEYITQYNEKGKVTGFKKKYSKGDGDLLLFELAFEKYAKDLQEQSMTQNSLTKKSLSQGMTNPIESLSSKDIYYLLTGKKSSVINMKKSNKSDMLSMYSRAYLSKFMNDFSQNEGDYSAVCRIKNNLTLRNRQKAKVTLSPDENYAIKHIDNKYVRLIDSKKTRREIDIPIDLFVEQVDEISFINHKDNNLNSILALQAYAEAV